MEFTRILNILNPLSTTGAHMTKVNRRSPQLFIYGLSLAAFILFVHLSSTIFVRSEFIAGILIGIGLPLYSLLAAASLFYAARQSAWQSRSRWAWRLLAASQFMLTVGGLMVLTNVLGYPVPELLIHGVCLCSYPLAILGSLSLPTKSHPGSTWWTTGLDMVIVLLVATLVLWRYWLSPLTAVVGDKSISLQLQALIYPISDLLLIWMLLTMLYRQVVRSLVAPVYLLVLGAGAMTIAHFNYGHQAVYGTFALGGWPDLGWVIASLCYGLAGLWRAANVASTHYFATTANDNTPERLSTWLSYLPALGVLIAFFILEYGDQHDVHLGPWATAAVGALIGLSLIRQMIMLSENNKFYGRIHQQATMLQTEIEERKRAEERLAHDAVHDPLTGLPDRVFFLDRLRTVLALAKGQPAAHFAVLFLDLDHFKVVNDSLGHMFGDQLLLNVAQRLQQSLRPNDTVARLGGDEFVILLDNVQDVEEAIAIATRIHTSLKQPFNLHGQLNFAAASIGIVCDDGHYQQPEDILRDADIAMYQAKTHGKDRLELFTVTMREQAQTRLALENDLHYALERQEFEILYQPILSLASDRIVGFEALLRWHHPQRGLISPTEFIPIAEETGLILPIGQWVLLAACRQLYEWQTKFPRTPTLTMNVNISGRQFAAAGFLEQVDAVLQEVAIDPHTLRLEITEGVWLNSSERAIALFKALHDKGVQFHIDDFGTGYSSLAYLQNFPIQTIKIDHTFVSRMGDSRDNIEIVGAIITMAHDLGMDAVAEGIETVEQLDKLKRLGCNYGQGYLLSRPGSQEETEKLLLATAPHTVRLSPAILRAA